MKAKLVSILVALLSAIAFVPLGLYLQWCLPIDGPFELLLSLASLPLLMIALVLLNKLPVIPPGFRKPSLAPLAVGLLVFFSLLQVSTLAPSITRRIGPWHELRSRLVLKSQEVRDARAQLGILENTSLTPEEWARIEETVFAIPEEFVFPILNKRVTLQMMSHVQPYIGLNYGGGRRVVFDLDTMWVIYAD